MNSTEKEEPTPATSTPITFIVRRSSPWRWDELHRTGKLPPWKAVITGHVSFVTLQNLRCPLGQDGILHPGGQGKLATMSPAGWEHVNPWSTELVYGADLPTAQEIVDTLLAESIN
jgi:hypothetical protein